ncbi:MAG: nicotinamide riboside transporter PnuC, partial [Bacteroidales bacterium]|nr:nicotinamide riboside transporter PnuC [Bacteroidales bacterium]
SRGMGMTLYGWYNWIFGGKKKYELPMRRIKGREVSVMLIIGIIFSFAMGYIIANYTDAAYPYWDSNLTVWGIIATYAMAKKILAHWLMWIIIDINCTALYFIKQMYAFSPLYFIFTLLAVYGYFQWKKDYKTEYSV